MSATQDTLAQNLETHEITRLLQAWSQGEQAVRDRLFELIYPYLHHLASRELHREKYQTLQPTELINLAYLKLVRAADTDWQSRDHFFRIAVVVMREVLVERARKRLAKKRAHLTLPLDGASLPQLKQLTVVPDETLLALDEALTRLEKVDARKVRVVEMVCFGGLEVEQAAAILGVDRSQVYRDWKFAKAWLHQALNGRSAS